MNFNPGNPEPLGTESFEFRRGPVGCLIIHGFTGTPPELLPLGEYLAERDITNRCVQLPGHGTTPQDMIGTRWEDWAGTAEQALLDLREECEEVFVAGLSMGGALTLYLAARYELPGAASLAGATLVTDWRVRWLLPALKLFFKYFPKDEVDPFPEPEMQALHKSYDHIPLPCLVSLNNTGLPQVRAGLAKITCPMLIVHSRKDEMLTMSNAELIYNNISSEKKEFVKLEESSHVVTLDVERHIVFEKVYDLIRRESKILN